MAGVLDGIKIIEVAQWWFVPAATAVLADWGAEVVKIEHPETGDPMRGLATGGLMPGGAAGNFMFEQPNRGKKSVGIDIGHPDGREALLRLVADADVFVTSFLPAARRRLGIDVDDIRGANPRIIYARGHGQGARGPDVERGGYDAASFWSRGGVGHALTADGADAPVMQRAAFGDSIGAMTLAGGIAGAIAGRERTGEPTVVDVSLLGTATWVLAPDTMAARMFGMAKIPTGDRRDNPNPIVNAYRTQDDRWIMLVMLESDRFWADFCRHINREDLITDDRFSDSARRAENKRECVELLDGVFASAPLHEWLTRLATLEGVHAPLQSAAELHDDRQVVANNYISYLPLEGDAQLPMVASPVEFGETPVALTHAPEHGQHTEEVLLAAGFDWDRIAELKDGGAIT